MVLMANHINETIELLLIHFHERHVIFNIQFIIEYPLDHCCKFLRIRQNTANSCNQTSLVPHCRAVLHITDMYDKRYIKVRWNEELNDLYDGKIKGDELEKKYSSAFGIKDENNFNVLDKLIESAKEVNRRRDLWNIFYRHDEDFWEYVEGNGKTKVSFTDDWESCLCNLMYLYRTVNWDDEMIMIIGG